MKTKRLFLIVLVLTLAASLAACAQATPVYAEGAEKDSVAAAVGPFAQDILDGIQANDYTLFATDFDTTMKTAMTQEKFDQIVTMFAGYGTFESMELTNVMVGGGYYRANYTLTFEKKVVIMGVVVPMEGMGNVSGLWFN
jgi:predicted small lipoprotein YifL